MLNIATKIDGVSTLPAAEFNNFISELKNIITSTGTVLTGADINQIVKAIADYVASGDFYQDSGVANAYVLTVPDNFKTPTSLRNGLKARFIAANSNSGASTINVASLGVKSLKKNNGTTDLATGDIVSGQLIEAYYNLSLDCFELNTEIASNVARLDITNDFNFNIQQEMQIKNYSETFSADGNVSGTYAINLSTANVHSATVTGNVTVSFTNVPAGSNQTVSLVLTLTNGGAHTITWPASVKWPGASVPSLTASGTDVLIFFTNNNGTTWYGFLSGANLS